VGALTTERILACHCGILTTHDGALSCVHVIDFAINSENTLAKLHSFGETNVACAPARQPTHG